MADDTAKLDLASTLKDSRFQSLPPTERHRFLTRNFPNYAQLPPDQQREFFMRNAMKHTSLGAAASQEIEGVFSGAGRLAGAMLTHDITGRPTSPAAADFPLPDPLAIPRGAAEQLTYRPPSVMQERPGIVSRTAGMLDFLVGGNPDAARAASERGDTGAEVAHALTVPVLTAGLGEVFRSMIPARQAIAPTRQEISSLRAMTGTRGITGTGPVDAVERTAGVQNLYKQALMERGVTDASLRDMFPTGERMGTQADIVGRVTRGNDLVLRTARDAVDIAERPLNAALKQYGKVPTGSLNLRIAYELRRQAGDLVDERIAKALDALADKVEGAKTMGDLNDLKVHANKLVNDVYSAVPGKAIAASAETAYAYKLAADAIRADMYPVLESMSGGKLDLGKMGQREADAIAMRDALHQTYYSQVSPQTASREASGFLGYVFGGEGPSHSLYSRHILARAAEKAHVIPGPGGKFNVQFRRGMESGEGAVPERVTVTPKQQLRLPPPPGGSPQPTFTIPGDLPQEFISGKSVTPAARGKDIVTRHTERGESSLAPHGAGAASVEELSRNEKFYKVSRSGQLTYMGVQPDATLRPGEAIVAVKSDGSMRVQDHRMGLSDTQVLDTVAPHIRRALQLGGKKPLGAQGAAVPERLMERPPIRTRSEQIGSLGSTVPERMISGSQDVAHTVKWKRRVTERRPTYTASSTSPTEEVSIQGPGTLYTDDVKAAQETLDRMRSYYGKFQSVMEPALRDRMKSAIDTLDQQLRDYHAYEGQVPPHDINVRPFKAGTRPTPHRRLKGQTHAAVAVGATRLTPPPKAEEEPIPDFDESAEPPE